MRLALVLALASIGCGLTPAVGTAQVFQPVGKQVADVSGALRDIEGKSAVYEPANPKEFKLFYIPFFAFEESQPDSHRPKVRLLKSPTPGNSLVEVKLLLSPQGKIDDIAAYIRESSLTGPGLAKYKDLKSINLSGIPLQNLMVTECEPRFGFREKSTAKSNAIGYLELIAEKATEDARRLADDIKEGKIVPRFDVSYDLAADQQLTQTDIQANSVYLYETKAAKNLASAKPCGGFGIQVEAGGVHLSQPFVSKTQMQEFEGRIKSEVSIILNLGNENDMSLVRDMTSYFDKIFVKTDVLKINGSMARELQNLSSYGLDPEELKADQLNKLVADVKNFFSRKDSDEHIFAAKASAAFLGIGSSGSVNTGGRSLREQMIEKGWKFEVEGKFSVPKSFEVHIVNHAALRSQGSVSGTIVRSRRGFIGFQHVVSASSLYHPSNPRDAFVEVTEIRNALNRLGRDVAAITKYEIIEAEYPNSNILTDVRNPMGAAVGTRRFSRPLKRVWVAISSVSTLNSGARPVALHYFTARATIDRVDQRTVHVYVGHHMSDGLGGAGKGGMIRILLIGDVE